MNDNVVNGEMVSVNTTSSNRNPKLQEILEQVTNLSLEDKAALCKYLLGGIGPNIGYVNQNIITSTFVTNFYGEVDVAKNVIEIIKALSEDLDREDFKKVMHFMFEMFAARS